jgi:hypothetical protein
MMPADPSNVERAVSRTLRDSLERMQRTAKELDQAVSDFVAACASNRPANALPSMMRAQTASASLSATLEVLSRFVTSSLQPADRAVAEPLEETKTVAAQVDVLPETVGLAPAQANAAESVTAEIPAAAHEAHETFVAAPQAIEWPTAPESTEWSEAHESHDAPVQAEPFEPELPLADTREPESQEIELQGAESLALEPPPDPALEPIIESALSENVSAMPDAIEPLASWCAPEQPTEPVAAEAAAGEFAADGIVEEAELVDEVDEATAIEESKIIEQAIAGGIAKMSELQMAEPVGAAQAVELSDAPGFDVALLSEDERELHRRASRVAKVSMQDIKLLQPQQVIVGRENKDLCIRLHEEIERAHKEYGRRFKPIMSHPVDYFYDWMVEILAAGDPSALGEYPYQTPALRR